MLTHKVRNMFLGSLLMSVLGGGVNAAVPVDTDNNVTDKTEMVSEKSPKSKPAKWEKKHEHQCGMFSRAWLGVGGDKHLTADDAKRIAEAALIWYNERSYKVAEVKPDTKSNGVIHYLITITDAHDAFVRQLSMNSKNGMVKVVDQQKSA